MLHECMYLLWLFYLLCRSQKLPVIFCTIFAGQHFEKGRKLAQEVSSNHFFPNGDPKPRSWSRWRRGWLKSNSRAQSSTQGTLLFILWALQHIQLRFVPSELSFPLTACTIVCRICISSNVKTQDGNYPLTEQSGLKFLVNVNIVKV